MEKAAPNGCIMLQCERTRVQKGADHEEENIPEQSPRERANKVGNKTARFAKKLVSELASSRSDWIWVIRAAATVC